MFPSPPAPSGGPRAGGRRELHGRSDSAGRLPPAADLPAVLGGEVAGELDGRRVMASAADGRLCGSGPGGVGRASPGRRVVRGGRVVPDDLPDRVDSYVQAGQDRSRVDRARPRRRGRSRLGGDPARTPPRRAGRGDGRLGGEAGIHARARRRGGVLVRGVRGRGSRRRGGRPGRRRGLRRFAEGADAARDVDRDRLRGRHVGGRQPGAGRRAERERRRLLPREADAARSGRRPRSGGGTGRPGTRARSVHWWAPSSPSPRHLRRMP